MPGNSYFISLIKDLNTMKTQYPLINTDLKENIKEVLETAEKIIHTLEQKMVKE